MINFEKGVWVSINNANNKNGYCIVAEQVYGAWINLQDTTNLEQVLLQIETELNPLVGSDSKTFEVCINPEYQPYGRDANYVYYPKLENTLFIDGEYYGGEIYDSNIRIDGADPKTFKYLGEGYAADKNNMYFEGNKIEWNDSLITVLEDKARR